MRGAPIIVTAMGLTVDSDTPNFARGFVGLLGHQQAIGDAFHITSDEVLTWNQICRTTRCAQRGGPYGHSVGLIKKVSPELGAGLIGDKAWSTVFDNRKVKALVPEFVARIPFHEGIRRTLAWFNADPARKRVDARVNAEMDTIIEAYQGTRNRAQESR